MIGECPEGGKKFSECAGEGRRVEANESATKGTDSDFSGSSR